MNTQVFERKLTAILSADVEGYSRLMGEDEDATIRTLTAYRELMSTLIQKHRGRVVDSPGDNILAEFLSVVDAVRCAVEIQEELRVRNDELPENRRMVFRIGINLGDVVAEGERIYGDGVNIAARVEGLAEGGGICISGTVYDSIKNKLSLSYEPMGEHTVKNIKEPIRVYRMRIGPEAAAPVIGDEKQGLRGLKKAALVAVGVLVVVAGSLAVWHFYFRPAPPPVGVVSKKASAPESVQKAPPSVPAEPSIAVLPFANISGDQKEDYLSDGITEQIIMALSKVPQMLVIARNSVFTYKGKPVMVQQVSEELRVRYVLEGSVQRSGDKLRVTAQLIDAKTGNHLWAERYDRNLKDLFDLQDEIAIKVLDGVRLKIQPGERATLHWPRVTNNLAAYLKMLKANEHYMRYNKNDNEVAQQLCHEAISLDPKYSAPYAMLAWSHLDACIFGWSKDWKECFTRCFEFAQKAISLNEFDSRGYIALSIYYGMTKEYDKGVSAGAKAVEIEPNGANANMLYADILSQAGRHEEALERMGKAIHLNPIPPVWYSYVSGNVLYRAERYEEAIPKMEEALRVVRTHPVWFLTVLGGSYWRTGQYDKAIEAYKRALNIAPDYLVAHKGLAISYSLSGDENGALTQVAEVLKRDPKWSIEVLKKKELASMKNEVDKERIINAMLKAGLAAPASTVASGSDTVADKHKARLAALYDVQKPEGSGPFPAVVAVSGCSGFHTEGGEPVYDKVISHLRDAGFVTIRVDYIGARNLKTCANTVSKDEVVADIFLAIEYLLDSGFVKASSINILGWSYGGGSALHALSKMPDKPDIKIGAVAAYYPHCKSVDKWNVAVPVLVLFGGEDTVAPPAVCKDLFAEDVSEHITIEEYPGAYHAFNLYTLPPKTEYQFGTIGYNKEASEKAWTALMKFLVR